MSHHPRRWHLWDVPLFLDSTYTVIMGTCYISRGTEHDMKKKSRDQILYIKVCFLGKINPHRAANGDLTVSKAHLLVARNNIWHVKQIIFPQALKHDLNNLVFIYIKLYMYDSITCWGDQYTLHAHPSGNSSHWEIICRWEQCHCSCVHASKLKWECLKYWDLVFFEEDCCASQIAHYSHSCYSSIHVILHAYIEKHDSKEHRVVHHS